MPLGPKQKSELELHWQHQKDHVLAEVRNVTRRLQNASELAAFAVVRDAYLKDGTLMDLSSPSGRAELTRIATAAVKALPAGD